MNIIDSIIMQLLGLTPQYTKHPLFLGMLTNMIAAAINCDQNEHCIFIITKKDG